MRLMTEFEETLSLANEVGENPTEWLFSKLVEGVFYKGERCSLVGGPEILGLPVKYDPDLPAETVQLRSGEKVVGVLKARVILDLDHS